MIKQSGKRVTVFLEGGTGNQLFMYFAGLSLSSKLNAELVLETKLIGKLGSDHGSFLHKVNLNAKINSNSSLTQFWIYTNRLFSALARRSDLIKRIQLKIFGIYRSIEVGYDPKILDLRKGVRLHGYFQSWKYYQYCSEREFAQIELLNPSDHYRAKLAQITEIPTVAVHVRRGDYGPLSETFGLLDESYYVNAVKSLFSSDGVYNIWIFSDDIREVKSSFADRIWEGAIFAEMDLDPIETIFLMSRASARVVSNSSFSYWSGMLSEHDSRNFAPSPWFRSLQDPKDLLPPEWTTIESSWLDRPASSSTFRFKPN